MLRVLLRHHVRFVIMGGYGAMVHRIAGLEPTTDIDICPLLDKENIVRLRDALAEMHAEPSSTRQRVRRASLTCSTIQRASAKPKPSCS